MGLPSKARFLAAALLLRKCGIVVVVSVRSPQNSLIRGATAEWVEVATCSTLHAQGETVFFFSGRGKQISTRVKQSAPTNGRICKTPQISMGCRWALPIRDCQRKSSRISVHCCPFTGFQAPNSFQAHEYIPLARPFATHYASQGNSGNSVGMKLGPRHLGL